MRRVRARPVHDRWPLARWTRAVYARSRSGALSLCLGGIDGIGGAGGLLAVSGARADVHRVRAARPLRCSGGGLPDAPSWLHGLRRASVPVRPPPRAGQARRPLRCGLGARGARHVGHASRVHSGRTERRPVVRGVALPELRLVRGRNGERRRGGARRPASRRRTARSRGQRTGRRPLARPRRLPMAEVAARSVGGSPPRAPAHVRARQRRCIAARELTGLRNRPGRTAVVHGRSPGLRATGRRSLLPGQRLPVGATRRARRGRSPRRRAWMTGRSPSSP